MDGNKKHKTKIVLLYHHHHNNKNRIITDRRRILWLTIDDRIISRASAASALVSECLSVFN